MLLSISFVRLFDFLLLLMTIQILFWSWFFMLLRFFTIVMFSIRFTFAFGRWSFLLFLLFFFFALNLFFFHNILTLFLLSVFFIINELFLLFLFKLSFELFESGLELLSIDMLFDGCFSLRNLCTCQSAIQKVLILLMSPKYIFILTDVELSLTCFFIWFGTHMSQQIFFWRHELVTSQYALNLSILKLFKLAFMCLKQFLKTTYLFRLFTVCNLHQL